MIGAIIAKRKAHAAFDALNKRDLSSFLADFREDAVFIYPGNLSVSGRIEGKKAIEQWFRKFLEQFPKFNFAVKNIFIRNPFALGGTNVVAVESDVTLTNVRGEFFKKREIDIIYAKGGKAVLVYLLHDLGTESDRRSWGENKV